MNAPQLCRIGVSGFRSLRDISLALGPMTVMIGPNGAGKSNLLSLLRMVSAMHAQSLRRFVGEQGGASALLHYGSKTTRELTIELDFEEASQGYGYWARLGYAAGDTLVFLDEGVWAQGEGKAERESMGIGAGHSESLLAQRAGETGSPLMALVSGLIGRLGFYHVHDTSQTSALRQNARQADNRLLHSDGSNLASFLFRLKASSAEGARASWNLVEGLVRRVAPFIKHLEPDLVDPERGLASAVRLYWVDERDYRFDTHDLSDGTLRVIALFTALAQPRASLPDLTAIDEPELGLHPAAIRLLASLSRSVSARSRVLLATQSPALLDEFEAGEVVVVERSGGETLFRRLSGEELSLWLEDFSLSELYDKNVLGGQP